ncbi:DEAD/DEAH box helicase [Serinibacter salmoneus]|nr:DEAD/DEAH box helicase [Serinibacter salmoneus]
MLLDSLTERGFTEPFPIQAATLPDSLAGRDVLGRGRTGSGKTLAFSLPLVARLAGGRRSPGRPRGLVLAPTRELASQIAETITPLARAAGMRLTTVFGGVGQGKQVEALNAGVDILVACPGRLEDLMGQGHVRLDAVQVAVLDEADHMADLGFLPGVTRIMKATPAGGQRLLFSATLDNGVDKLVKQFMSSPVTHSVDPASAPVASATHHILEVADAGAKKEIVEHLASGTGRRVLFTRTKHQARQVARRLTSVGIPAADLHGNLSQGARERNLGAFHSGAIRVLVATDIAARGIHVDEVDLVVHVDPPAEHKAYLHRSGRTARAGASGDVVTLVLPEQRADMRQLARAAKITATPQRVTPGATALVSLVGEVAPRVAEGELPEGAARKPQAQPTRKKAGAKAGARAPRSGGRSGATQGVRSGSRSGARAATASGGHSQSAASDPRSGGQRPRRGSSGKSGQPASRGKGRGRAPVSYTTSSSGSTSRGAFVQMSDR